MRRVSLAEEAGQARHYTEQQDRCVTSFGGKKAIPDCREMDIWVVVSDTRSAPRHLTLLVTPYRKQCGPGEPGWRRCSAGRCVKRELFCDGRVNCAGQPGGRVLL